MRENSTELPNLKIKYASLDDSFLARTSPDSVKLGHAVHKRQVQVKDKTFSTRIEEANRYRGQRKNQLNASVLTSSTLALQLPERECKLIHAQVPNVTIRNLSMIKHIQYSYITTKEQ